MRQAKEALFFVIFRSKLASCRHSKDAPSTSGATALPPNPYVGVNARDNQRWAPLHHAAADGLVAAAQAALAKKANVNCRDSERMTPLHLAATRGNVEITRVLIDHGADVNARNKRGYRPLQCAADDGHYECSRLLIEMGAEIDARASIFIGGRSSCRPPTRPLAAVRIRTAGRRSTAQLATVRSTSWSCYWMPGPTSTPAAAMVARHCTRPAPMVCPNGGMSSSGWTLRDGCFPDNLPSQGIMMLPVSWSTAVPT